MALSWREEGLKRPDRYLDWEFRNRVRPSGIERWAPVLLQIEHGPHGDAAANLRRLQQAARSGKVDPQNGMDIRIVMHGDEKQRLEKLIQELTAKPSSMPPEGHVSLDFYVYIHEEDIYTTSGTYNNRRGFKIEFAGPPIPGSFDARFALPPTRISPMLPAERPNRRAVAIGIIDDGIAFAHERFRSHADGISTRIAAFWRQEIEKIEDRSVVFGEVFDKERIDGLFKTVGLDRPMFDEDAVYRKAGMRDFRRERLDLTALRRAHGTHVMDLACGFDPNDPAEQERAAYFPILAVQLPDAVTADTSGVNMGSYVLQGLRQIMLWADNFPCSDGSPGTQALPLVVNFSYGINAGPKDGSFYLERQIERLIDERRSRAPTEVVLPAGNTFRSRMTALVKLKPGCAQQLDWMILPDDATPSFAEIWFDADADAPSGTPCPVKITITPPGGPAGTTLAPRAEVVQVLGENKAICGVYYDVFNPPDAPRGRARIFLAVSPTKSWDDGAPLAPSGRWQIRLESDRPLTLYLYVQRDDTVFGFRPSGRQSFFDHPQAYERDPSTGDYDGLDKNGPIAHEATLSAMARVQCWSVRPRTCKSWA